MATAAQLFEQRLNPIAIGEDAVQEFVGRFATDISGGTYKFSLSSTLGSAPILVLTTTDGDISVAGVADGSEFVVTWTITYLRADTITLTALDYHFDLWRTDSGSNNRIAAGVQPVVTPARLEP